MDDDDRLGNFNYANIFGPIFICSCCHRRLYENGVAKITEEFKAKVNTKKPNFYNVCIKEEIHVNIIYNGSSEKSDFYICISCKDKMIAGKVPSIAVINGLELIPMDKNCCLTELENNLIAKNIIFQYFFCLQKSKKQMISVPVGTDSVINTIQQLPRLPAEAGLIAVGLKRKQSYKQNHKKEYIDANKNFLALDFLRRSGHP